MLLYCYSDPRVPGEQDWARQTTTTDVAEELAALNLSTLPPALKGKHPLPLPEYTGALLKVYSDFSPSPASVYDVVGVVSSAAMPSPYTGDEEEEVTLVPAIHVLVPPTPFSSGSKPAASDPTVRTELVDYLASAFNPPDKVAGELLLLALLARPAARPTALPPLGTFNLNLVRPKTDSAALETTLASLHPHTLPLQLTIPLLHSSHFRPSSTDGTSLTPGLLQLAPGTLLQINEDGLGDGGALAQNALQNLQALTEALDVQSVHYQYPYMDSLRIECALRSVITSEGKSLLPADAVLPVTLAESYTPPANLAAFRAYLSAHGSLEHATALTIPDAIAEMIQDQFVSERKAGKGSVEAAEARLKRRMKIARVLALSHGDELTPRIWEQALALDDEVEKRNVQREEKRREGKIGAPNPNTEIELD